MATFFVFVRKVLKLYPIEIKERGFSDLPIPYLTLKKFK